MGRLGIALALAVAVSAIPAQGTEIAIVNIDQVLSEARPVRAAIEAVDAEVALRHRHLGQREEELLEMTSTYRTQASLWSDEVRNEQQREIIERQLELQELETDIQQFLDQSQRETIEPAFETIYQAIRDIAEENDIDAVARSDAFVYAAEDLDITAEVIDLLNRHAPQPLNLPEGQPEQ